MPFRLIVQSALERHRPEDRSIIAKMTFALKVAGASVTQVAPLQKAIARFDVTNDSPGTELDLEVQIPPLGSMTKPILSAKQKFRIVRARHAPASGPTSPVLEPVAGAKGLLHPRFRGPRAVGAGRTMQIVIEIDTTWLDLTDYALSFANDKGAMRRFVQDQSHRSRLLIAEHSSGGQGRMPTTWLILVPPALQPTEDRINTFLFFRPEITKPPDSQYSNTDDVPFGTRFLRYVESERKPGRYIDISRPPAFSPFRSAGFEAQLVASGKPVVLLFPMPHVTDFGALTTARLMRADGSANGVSILNHLLRSLWADGSLAASASTAPTVKRLALGGFSLGGDVCLQSWAANADRVDELYLFDPGQGIVDGVASWFTAKPSDRRLRMMGCAYSETSALRIAGTIEKFFKDQGTSKPPGHWVAKPGDPLFWYGGVYARALSNPDTPQDVESLDQVGSAATSGATKKSNVFMTRIPGGAAMTPLGLTAKWPGGPASVPSFDVPIMANAEAAAYLRYHIVDKFNGGRPVGSLTELNVIHQNLQKNDFNEEQPRTKGVRHEWAVIGGEERSGTFAGYLQLCLEGSGFV